MGKGEVAGVEVVLAKPQTYMNRSGIAVAALVRKYKLPLSDLLVIYDDLDPPLGRIRAPGPLNMSSARPLLGKRKY